VPMQVDTTTLQMALIGYQSQLSEINAKMQEIRRRLGGARAAVHDRGRGDIPGPVKRVLSAAARRRIVAAQKKRWAAYRQSGAGAKRDKPKRTMSPEAKAKLAANLAKARAARAAKAKATTA
jgi:hypothetical protein